MARLRTSAVNRDGIFHLFDSNDPKGEIQLLVAAAAGDGYWLEVSDNEEHIAALIIADTSKGYLDYKVKEIKFTEGGKLKHYNEAELIDDQAEDELEKVNTWLSLLVYSLHDGVYRNVQLPAGQFLAIREVPMSLSLRLGRMSGYLWYHNAVPIVPVVKINLTTSTSEWFKTTESTELVDFGSVGQKSNFSYE